MGQFNETQIYKDGMELLKILSSKVKNMPPTSRDVIGNHAINHLALFMLNMKKMWKEDETNIKLKYIEEALEELDSLSLFYEILETCENITPKQSAPIVLYIGKLMQQTGGLRKKYII